MIYLIEYTEEFERDLEKHKLAGSKILLLKINSILNELRVHPTTGLEKPELLKHYSEPTWSRRISDKHRLVYRINEDTVIVLVITAWGHYGDK